VFLATPPLWRVSGAFSFRALATNHAWRRPAQVHESLDSSLVFDSGMASPFLARPSRSMSPPATDAPTPARSSSVPVANKPILFYGLEDMASAGHRRYRHHRGRHPRRDQSRGGRRISIGASHVTYTLLRRPHFGLAHCVLIARNFPRRRRLRDVVSRDNLLQQGLTEFTQRFAAARTADSAAAQRPRSSSHMSIDPTPVRRGRSGLTAVSSRLVRETKPTRRPISP